MVDVFISYSRENQALVRRLAEAVKREGYSVWWDSEVPPHLSYGDVIAEKIGSARAAIVVWSARAAGSQWVRAEADLAREQKKLIQTSVDDRMPPMPFNQIQFASIGDWQGEPDHPGWMKVKASLAALCGAPGAASRTPPQPPPSYRRPADAPPAPRPAPARPATRARDWRVAAAVLGVLILLLVGGGTLLWMRGIAPAEAGGGPVAPATGNLAMPAPATPPTVAPRVARASFTQAAVIDDPAGFVPVRSGPSEAFPLVARVNDGEVFTTYPQDGQWWQVRTANGRVGYMARDRIRAIDPTAAPASAAVNLDGFWTGGFSASGTDYQAAFEIRGDSGVLVVDTVNQAGAARIREECAVQVEGEQVGVQCRNPVFLAGSGDYLADRFDLTLADPGTLQGRVIDTSSGVTGPAAFSRR